MYGASRRHPGRSHLARLLPLHRHQLLLPSPKICRRTLQWPHVPPTLCLQHSSLQDLQLSTSGVFAQPFPFSMSILKDIRFFVSPPSPLSPPCQVLLFSFVSLAIIVTYIRIFVAARRASGTDQAAAMSASQTVGLHAIQLLFCMSSFLSPMVNRWLVDRQPRLIGPLLFGSYLLTNVMPRLLSPLIYGLRDRKFNSQVRVHLCVCCTREALQGRPPSGVKTPGGHRR